VVKNRGQHCDDVELTGYLTNETGPVTLMLDLLIVHDRVGSSTDPTLNGQLRHPNNLDQSLNDVVVDKVREYHGDYNMNPVRSPNSVRVTLYHLCRLLLVRLGGYMVNLSDFYSYRLIGKLTAFLQLQEFRLRNQPVESSTSVGHLSLQEHILTQNTRKHLVY
jgi:hypothetical protein